MTSVPPRPFGPLLLSIGLALVASAGMAQIPCDFSGDGDCNILDVNALAKAISAGVPEADLDNDGDTDVDDLEFHLANAVNRLNGDFDFRDGVDFADFLRFSDNFGKRGRWSEGDLTGDGTVQFPDFLILADNFGKSEPPMQPTVSVEVTEDDGLFTYTYTIENSAMSPTGINVVFLDVANGVGVVHGSPIGFGQFSLDAPTGWSGEYLENSGPIEEVAFIQASGPRCGLPGITGGGVERFSIESEFGPGERALYTGHLVSSCDHFFAEATVNVLAPSIAPGAGVISVPEPMTGLAWWFAVLGFLRMRSKRLR